MISRIAPVAKLEGPAKWRGDLRGALEGGGLVDSWMEMRGEKKMITMAKCMARPLQDILRRSVLSFKIDMVEWWHRACSLV